ncbi:low molecular weight phosphotyrosine protein phosphatase [Rhodobacteraceae bacterium D3-12]|nr:low molecular weight phosphotyrosine protein phosphatase [Rhodobacteraceae bacterium D3-12]
MRVLFVCLGNICRSPAAEGVFRALSDGTHDTESAGTSDWHIGEPPYAPMIQAAKARGTDLSNLRARQATAQDFTRFDLLIAMDDSNLQTLETLRPAGNTTPLHLFTDFAADCDGRDVPDPYYTRDFDGVLDLIETCANGLNRALADNTITGLTPRS